MDRPPLLEDVSGFFKFHGVSDFTFESGLLVGSSLFFSSPFFFKCCLVDWHFNFSVCLCFSPDDAVGVEVPS